MAVPKDESVNENESSAKSSDSLIHIGKGEKDSFISWIVCACGFIARAIIVGVLHGFGSFFIEFVKEFNISKECSGTVSVIAIYIHIYMYDFISPLPF